MALLVVFFLSGVAALVYQIVWQRVLFTIYGLDVTSVTIVVTAFMLGLGIGSLIGGWLSRRLADAALYLFAGFELAIAAFGFLSVAIFEWVGSFTLGAGHATTAAISFGLLLLPTAAMGATLPLLVGHSAQRTLNVGRSVGELYFANTLGGAAGAFLAAGLLLGSLGLAGSARASAVLNAGVGLAVVSMARRDRHRSIAELDLLDGSPRLGHEG